MSEGRAPSVARCGKCQRSHKGHTIRDDVHGPQRPEPSARGCGLRCGGCQGSHEKREIRHFGAAPRDDETKMRGRLHRAMVADEILHWKRLGAGQRTSSQIATVQEITPDDQTHRYLGKAEVASSILAGNTSTSRMESTRYPQKKGPPLPCAAWRG